MPGDNEIIQISGDKFTRDKNGNLRLVQDGTQSSTPAPRFGNASDLPPLVSPYKVKRRENATLENIVKASRNKDYVNPNPNVDTPSKIQYNPYGMADESTISNPRNDIMDKVMQLITKPVQTAVSGTGEGIQQIGEAGNQIKQGNIGTGLLAGTAGIAQTGMSLATPFVPVMSAFDVGGQALENAGLGDVEKYAMSPVESLTNPTSLAGKSGAKLADLLYNLLVFKGVDKGIKNLRGEPNASTVRGDQEVIPEEGKVQERGGEVSGNDLQQPQTGGSQAGNEGIRQQGTEKQTSQDVERVGTTQEQLRQRINKNQESEVIKPTPEEPKRLNQGSSFYVNEKGDVSREPVDKEALISEKNQLRKEIDTLTSKAKLTDDRDTFNRYYKYINDRRNRITDIENTLFNIELPKEENNPKVISTAVKKGNELITGDNPTTSHDEIGQQKGIGKIPEQRKGFLVQDETGKQKFVGREEAAKIANEAGQTTEPVTELHSEDLKPIEPPKKGRVMSLKSVEGEGETKVRGLSQRFSNDMSKDIQDNFDLPEYNARKNAPQIQKVSDIAASDPERLVRMYQGKEKIPDNILPGFIYSGVKQLAKEGKISPELLTDLANSDFIAKQGTSAGQVVQSFIDKDPLDPINAIKEITKVREDNVLKRSGVKDIDKVKDRVADQISKETKKHNLKPNDWTSFIESIRCK